MSCPSLDPLCFRLMMVNQVGPCGSHGHQGARRGPAFSFIHLELHPWVSPELSTSSPRPLKHPPPRPTGPVRMDWSTRSVVDLMVRMRMSAGTLSPTVERVAESEVSRERSFLPSQGKPDLGLTTSPGSSRHRGWGPSPGLSQALGVGRRSPSKHPPPTLIPTAPVAFLSSLGCEPVRGPSAQHIAHAQ